MTNEEKKFEQYVNSLRFDDGPAKDHQDKLEKELLAAYDQRQESGRSVEPVSLYMRKMSMAAGFLIACGVLFWGIDKAFITAPHPDFIANHPDRAKLEKIIEDEQAAGANRKNLLVQIRNIWQMINDKDADGLVSVLRSNDIARSIRTWAAEHLGRFGNQQTLEMLDSVILKLGVNDPNDPLNIAADQIRKRLKLPESKPSSKAETLEAPSMSSLEKQIPGTE